MKNYISFLALAACSLLWLLAAQPAQAQWTAGSTYWYASTDAVDSHSSSYSSSLPAHSTSTAELTTGASGGLASPGSATATRRDEFRTTFIWTGGGTPSQSIYASYIGHLSGSVTLTGSGSTYNLFQSAFSVSTNNGNISRSGDVDGNYKEGFATNSIYVSSQTVDSTTSTVASAVYSKSMVGNQGFGGGSISATSHADIALNTAY